MVAAADKALAARHWREPTEGSLAGALTNLAIEAPGNANIRRLRQAAADILLPTGQRALERRRWRVAADSFRDLVAVWPDQADARAGLAEALYEEARVLKSDRDHVGVLAAADELLNVVPGEFRAVLLRAEALMALRRYAEAKQAWGEARRIKPRSREVLKGYYKASQLARKGDE